MREVVPSAARTTTGQSGALTVGPDATGKHLNLALDVTAVAGTGPTLDLSVEWSTDNGATWFAASPADAFAQVNTPTKVIKAFEAKAQHYRLTWTIAGTTGPSFTFAVDEYAY